MCAVSENPGSEKKRDSNLNTVVSGTNHKKLNVRIERKKKKDREKPVDTYLKVTTTLVVGHPMTNDVSCDLISSVTSSKQHLVNHISEILTFSLSLKLPPERGFATNNKSLNKNRCRSWLWTPCKSYQKNNIFYSTFNTM